MSATAQQLQAIEFLDAFWDNEIIRTACLQGYAGVGKTWVTSHWLESLLERNPGIEICVCAPTHKALDVLRGKCGHLNVTFKTVASLLGQFISRNDDGELTKGESERVWTFDLVACDEGSMVSREQRDKLEARGFKLVYIGDPAQLPPVGEDHSPAFDCKHKFLMTEVVRYAADNPVTGICTMLRERIDEGQSFTLSDIYAFARKGDNHLRRVKMGDQLYDWAQKAIDAKLDGRILSYTNQSVLQHNTAMHKRLFPAAPLFGVGEKVLVNDAYALPKSVLADPDDEPEMLTNGTVMEVLECTLAEPCAGVVIYDVLCLHPDGRQLNLPVALYEANAKSVHKMLTEQIWALRKKLNKTEADRVELRRILKLRKPLCLLAPLRHAYASTVHKSQGSTYDISFIDWSDVFRSEDRARLAYVAFSRTSNYAVVAEG